MFDIQIYKNGVFINSLKGYSHILEPDKIVNFPTCFVSHWDSSITMRDFFSIIEANPEKWQYITGNKYVIDYVEEFQRVKNCPQFTSADLYYLELSWHSELLDDIKENEHELIISTRFNGIGPPDKYSNGSTNYGIDFIPLENLLELEIKLNPQFHIWSGDIKQEIKLSAKKKFSVADVVFGIFWELTWDGGPKEKKEALEKLKNSK